MSFGRPDDAQLVAALLDDPKAQPIVSLLAEMDGTAIGHVLFPNAAVEGDRVRVPASLLAPLAVIPDAQRRGVGQAHIAAGIDTLAALGIGLVFVMRSWSAENGTIDHRLRQERPIMRLLHTMIRVGDLDRSIAFYTDVLGMKLLRRKDYPEGKFTLAFVGYGDEASNSAIELTYNWGVNQYELGSGFGHIALEVDDVHRAADEIRQRGGKILREAGPMNAGTTIIAFVADPDGYPIELIGRRS